MQPVFVRRDENDVDSTQATTHYATAKAITDDGGISSWWIWHSPAVQRINYDKGTFGDPDLRDALLDAVGKNVEFGKRFCGTLPTGPNCKPAMFLLGHQHLYQDVTFKTAAGVQNFPRGTTVCHGGVTIRNSNPAPGSAEYCLSHKFPLGKGGAANVTGQIATVAEHGMLYWTRSAATLQDQLGWTPEYVWARDMSWKNGDLKSTPIGPYPPLKNPPDACAPVH